MLPQKPTGLLGKRDGTGHRSVKNPCVIGITPTSNDTIYCTWLSDFALYGLYQIGGFGALFALRYFCVALCGSLLFLFARTRSVQSALPALTVIFVSLAAIVAGTIIKSEIFSLVAFSLLIFVCVMGRSADRSGSDPTLWFLSVPVILTVWVNAHGGFIFAARFSSPISPARRSPDGWHPNTLYHGAACACC